MKIVIVSILLFIALIVSSGCLDNHNSAQITPSQRTKLLKTGPVIEVEKQDISLGSIPLTTKVITGKVKFRNIGTELLEIKNVSGSCSCFAGYSGDKKVEPGETGEITVNFDKNSMPRGMPVKRLAKIKTNDPNNEVVNVYFSFVVQDKSIEEDIRLLPQTIDYGRVFHEAFISRGTVPVRLIIPVKDKNEAVNVEIVPSTDLLTVEKIEDNISKHTADNNFHHTIIYHLSWHKPPIGLFKEYLTFVIKRRSYGEKLEIKLPIRGDSL